MITPSFNFAVELSCLFLAVVAIAPMVLGNLVHHNIYEIESMAQRIEQIRQDLDDIGTFYSIEISPLRRLKFQEYYKDQLTDLQEAPFDSYDQQSRIDFLLLKNYLRRNFKQLELDMENDNETIALLPFTGLILQLIEDRQNMVMMDGKKAAQDIYEIGQNIFNVKKQVLSGKLDMKKTNAFRAAKIVDDLSRHLVEWFDFFNGYDPMFSWWVAEPYRRAAVALTNIASTIREELVGIKPGNEDAIVGSPIGYTGLLADLKAEKIPYTPEEIIAIGEKEWEWCEAEMKKAAREMGFDNWREALEVVKNNYVEPGAQPSLIRDLAQEAIDYVQKHDLITVPSMAAELWPMFMMPPADQKVNPFFLGGESIIVAYPTDGMGHEAKLMSMRGNNIHFARATVFHELIPGHHLQMHMVSRYRAYRQMFDTPFWIEGWSLYWEMILWDKGFQRSAEDKIGMLFWRMHRCARIIFSIKFHLGEMSADECIEMLVENVGHERATAEGEVRRSFNGDYSPLYQAGYMLGALQLYAMRREIVDAGFMTEKEFHDRIMRENEMPIEFLRALILEIPVTMDYNASWRFYDDL